MEYKLRTPKLLPLPKKAVWGGGFLEWEKAEFQIDDAGLPCGAFLTLERGDFDNPEAYRLRVSEDGISIVSASDAGARAALQTLRQIGMQADSRGFRFVEMEDSPDIGARCFVLDISRGRVPTLADMRLLADRLSLFKYNRLELRLGGAYPFEGREREWAGRGLFTPKKIAALKKYCAVLGIELSCGLDASEFQYGSREISEISANFDCADFDVGSPDDASELCSACAELGKRPLCAAPDAGSQADFSAPAGAVPIFSASSEGFAEACAKAHSQKRAFFVSANAGIGFWDDIGFLPRLDSAKAEIDAASNAAKKYGAEGFVLCAELSPYAPFAAVYPPLARAAAKMWGGESSEEAECEALDSFAFYDASGDFARALCALGRIDGDGILECAFFGLGGDNAAFDTDDFEGAADFAMGLAATSKPECRDASILSAEIALAGAMARRAVDVLRGRGKTAESGTALKFLVSDFENIWNARNETGGLWEASAKIRATAPEIFKL